ncbi:hypothetical protein PACILC2_22100 [Paenibacillus cisolokensis]|uniref:Tape measure protein n=2 Tax=Paenibacillus cisolokensis TaxID=1658519 RepID=A0ABQ4N660_9BACL|nr:hypothetical protein PACILC2_22100 [Paenibacillus cisolokensis]
MIAKLWAMIPPLYAQAVAWLAINWPILAVIAAIALVLFILNQLGISADQILGAIAGAFLVLASVIWNTVVGVINAVIQFLWTAFVEPWIGIIEWVLNVFNGGFNSFGDAVKNLLGQIISWFLSLGKVVTKIIDAIFGTDWTAGLESLQDSLLKWGKNEQAITLSRDAPTIDARIDYGDAWNKGYRWGSDLADSFKGLTKSFDTAANNLSWPQSGRIPGGKLPDIDKVKKVGKIEDKVDISSEDLKTMRELAEMKSIQNFVTLTPTFSFGDTHIKQEGRSIDEIIERITVRMNEELAASAKGLFS